MHVYVCVRECVLRNIKTLKFPGSRVGGDLLSENKIVSCILYNSYFSVVLAAHWMCPGAFTQLPLRQQ